MISTVLIPNIIAISLLLVLLLSTSSVSRHTKMPDTRIFVLMLGCNIFQCAEEMLTFAIDGKMYTGFQIFSPIFNSALFVVNIFFAFLWVVYADYKIYEDIAATKKRARIAFIPAAVIMLGVLLNLFVPIFFSIDANNVYHRERLFFIPYLCTYLYLLYGTVFIYQRRSQAKKYVFLPAGLFMIPIVVGSLVQFFFYGFSTTWVGVAIALMAVYVNMQNEASYTDSLSGLYTRIYMYHYLENALRKKSAQNQIAGIMLDIDNFKSINDTMGHLTGDDAIRSVGKILLQILPPGSIAARYGGDEFVIVQEISSEEELAATLRALAKSEEDFAATNDKKYILHFSKGYTVLDPNIDTVDSFLERMDREMYAAKNA